MARRPLGSIENALHITGTFAPMAVAGVVRLRGAPTEEVLRKALDVLQLRHPLLRARVDSSRRPAFEELDPAPPIPLDVRDRTADDQWLAVVADVLNTGLDSAAGPLMAATYLVDSDDPGSADLVLAHDHAFVDAASAARVYLDLLRACTQPQRPDPLPLSDGAPGIAPPLDALVPDRLRGVSRVIAAGRFLGAQMAEELAYQIRAGGEPMPIHPTARNVPLTRTIDAEITAALVRRARHRRLTTHSVLQAALLRATATHLAVDQPRPLRAIGFVDLRSTLRPPPAPEELGCYMTMLRTTLPVAATDDLWTIAASYQTRLRKAIAADEPLISAAMAPMLMKGITATRRMRMATTAVSYVGPLPAPPPLGQLEVTDVHGFISNNRLGPYATACTSILDGRLTLDFVFLESDLPGEAAAALADAVVEVLTGAAGR